MQARVLGFRHVQDAKVGGDRGGVVLLVWVAAPIATRSGVGPSRGSLLLALPASMALALVWAGELTGFLAQSSGWKDWVARFPGETQPLVEAVERGAKDMVLVAERLGQFKDDFQRTESLDVRLGKSVMCLVWLFLLTVPGLHLLATNHFLATVFGLVLIGVGGLAQALCGLPRCGRP